MRRLSIVMVAGLLLVVPGARPAPAEEEQHGGLKAEIAARKAADADLQRRLNAEIARAKWAEAALRAALAGLQRAGDQLQTLRLIAVCANPVVCNVTFAGALVSIDGQNLSVGGLPVTVSDDTTIRRGGDRIIVVSGLSVGDRLLGSGQRQADGSVRALVLDVFAALGALAAVREDAFTIGETAVLVDEHTIFGGSGDPHSLSDLRVGDFVAVTAVKRDDGTLLGKIAVRLSPCGLRPC